MSSVILASNESPPCVAAAAAAWQTAERGVSAGVLVDMPRNHHRSGRTLNDHTARSGGVFSLARARQEREREDVLLHPKIRHNVESSTRTSSVASDTVEACGERMRKFDSLVAGGSSACAIIPNIVASCISNPHGDLQTVSNAVTVTETTTSGPRGYPRGSTFALISQQAGNKEQRRNEIVNRSSELDRRLTIGNSKAFPTGLHAHANRSRDARPVHDCPEAPTPGPTMPTKRSVIPRQRRDQPSGAGRSPQAEW